MIAEISTIMATAGKAIDFINNNDASALIERGQLGLNTQGSITKLIAETIIAPRIIISESLKTNKDIDKIINLNIDIIAGMISKAFFLLTELKGLTPNTAFDVLKTDKKAVSGLQSLLGYQDEENLTKLMRSSKGLTFGKNKDLKVRMLADKPAEKEEKSNRGKDDISALYSKDIDLKLTIKTKDGSTKSLTIPIIVKAHISYNSLSVIKESLIDKKFEKDMEERILEANAGMISWKNFWLPFDMLKEYKEKRIKDVDSLLAYTEERSKLSLSKLASSGMQSLGTYLGALIVSYSDMEDIENNVLRGSISKDAKREIFFTNSKVSLLDIVDPDFEKLTIITKDIEGQSLMDLKSLKKSNGGNEVNDLFKDLLMNRRF